MAFWVAAGSLWQLEAGWDLVFAPIGAVLVPVLSFQVPLALLNSIKQGALGAVVLRDTEPLGAAGGGIRSLVVLLGVVGCCWALGSAVAVSVSIPPCWFRREMISCASSWHLSLGPLLIYIF